jgi:hypothetical protein
MLQTILIVIKLSKKEADAFANIATIEQILAGLR